MAHPSKNTALHIISIILGLFLAFAGVRKLFTNWEEGKSLYLQHFPLWVYYASGVVEFTCGPSLLFPRTRFLAAIALLIMITCTAMHPWNAHSLSLPFLLPAIISTGLLVWVAWRSRPARRKAALDQS